jgi:hypothetical protein
VALSSCTLARASLGSIHQSRIDGWSATHMFYFLFSVVSELWLWLRMRTKEAKLPTFHKTIMTL